MFDTTLRRAIEPSMRRAAAAVDVPGVTPNRLTAAGLVLGLISAVLAALQWWSLACIAWVLSRTLDGLDGALARRRRRESSASEVGGFVDIMADFTVYGATVVGVAVGATNGYGAPWWPFLVVIFAYYLNGTAFLAFSSIAERTGRQIDDGRSLSFLGRIAEGAETIVVHSLWLLLPAFAWQLAVVWGGFVLISAVHRVVSAVRILR